MTIFSPATIAPATGPAAALVADGRYHPLQALSPELAGQDVKALLGRHPAEAEGACRGGTRGGDLAEAWPLAPVPYPDTLLAVGATYAGHLEEMGLPVEKWPVVPFFVRPVRTALVGAGRDRTGGRAGSHHVCRRGRGNPVMTADARPALAGIHHIKLPVSDLARSLAFYETLLGARRIPAFDHRTEDGTLYAHICEVPGLGTKLELRLNPRHAEAQRRFDPVTIAVKDRDTLRQWVAVLDGLGIAHSGEIVAIQAWLVSFDDPDQHRLRFYTLETHGPELKPDVGNPWLEN